MTDKRTQALLQLNKCLAFLLVIWLTVPIVSQRSGLIIGMGIVALWSLTAIALGGISLSVSKDTVCMIIWVYLAIISYVFFRRIYASYEILYYLPMAILFFMPYYVAKFYFNRNMADFVKKLALASVVGLIVGQIFSIYYSSIVPGIMKTIEKTWDDKVTPYLKSGIGGFGFVYLTMFSAISVIASFKGIKRVSLKIFLIFFVILSIVCLIQSTYTTAILIGIVGLLIMLINKIKDRSVRIILCVLIPMLLIIFANLIGTFLINLPVTGEGTNTRLREIGDLIVNGEVGINLEGRMTHLTQSLECFFHLPFLGSNFTTSGAYSIGTHSEWFDILGSLGIIGAIPVFATLYFKLKFINDNVKKHTGGTTYKAIIITFIIFGFLDPIIRIYHLGLAMFLVIPGILCLNKQSQGEMLNENSLGS